MVDGAKTWTTLLTLTTTLLLGCKASPPRVRIDFAPARLAPGEPLRVSVAATRPGDVEVALAAADGERLATAIVSSPTAPTTLWLYPSHPTIRGDFRLTARQLAPEDGLRIVIPLDVDRPVVAATETHGAHPREEGYFWTTGDFKAAFENLEGNALLHLRYRCGGESPRQSHVAIDDRTTSLRCMDNAVQQLQIDIPRHSWHQRPFLSLGIRTEPSFKPSELFGGGDERELGIQIFELFMTRVDGD